MDCNAGWRAKTNVPIPITVVKAEKKMAVLCEFSNCRPVRYLFCNPSIMKMLKSSPIPKIKVDRMMLMILNSIPSMPINPTMIIQLTSIGRKLIRVSSMRP